MCGRYFLEEEALRDVLEQIRGRYQGMPELELLKLGEIAPSETAPVVTAQGCRLMRWGFARPGSKGLIINARAETALERGMFAQCAKSRRLVVPAAGYYEWRKLGKDDKAKCTISRADGPIYMAGLWRQEPDQKLPSFVILTTDAAPQLEHIHDRMPLLLGRDQLRAWLWDDEAALRILRDARGGAEVTATGIGPEQMDFLRQ